MNFDLIVDLHKRNARLGPGSDFHTKQALSLAGLLSRQEYLKIADIGCGTGASTLALAQNLNAEITAVDLFPAFLDLLEGKAKEKGVAEKISRLECSMGALPFDTESLDVIWSEGALYNLGFKKAIEYLKQFLKSGGIIAASEITWLTDDRPHEIDEYWNNAYPEIATAAEKIAILQEHGFILKGYFPLPKECWLEEYYRPLKAGFDNFLQRHDPTEAQEILDAENHEIALYEKYHSYYSYGFYIAEKI